MYLYLTVIEDYSCIQAPHLSEMYAHCSHSSTCEDQFLAAEGTFYTSSLKGVSHKAHNLFNTDEVASSITQTLSPLKMDVLVQAEKHVDLQQVCSFLDIKVKNSHL